MINLKANKTKAVNDLESAVWLGQCENKTKGKSRVIGNEQNDSFLREMGEMILEMDILKLESGFACPTFPSKTHLVLSQDI